MKGLLRDTTWILLAGLLTWFAVLRPVEVANAARPRVAIAPIPVALTPVLEDRPAISELAALETPEDAPQESSPPEALPSEPESAPAEFIEEPAPFEPEAAELEPTVAPLEPSVAPLEPSVAPLEPKVAPLPAPPELGAPEGEELEERALVEAPERAASQPEEASVDLPAEPSWTSGPSVEELMADPGLLATAGAEVSGEASRGFATVLLAAPEEQLDIARLFGEEIVLVPRRALDPDVTNPTWFRVATDDSGRVERMAERPPLERYRQYRDLFDYEYARLPESLRSLRRSVLARNEIYLFAALIPVREWALIIARRTAALEHSGRELTDVRRFVLRYIPTPESTFDLRVEEILFADGSRFRPDLENSD